MRIERVLNAALLLVGGAVFGTLMTFGHQADVEVAGAVLPWGLMVALLGVTALLVGVRLLAGRRPTIWLAAGLVSAIVVLALPGPGGSILIPNGLAGMVWSLAPSFIAILVVLWPAPRQSRSNLTGTVEAVERTTP